MQSVKLIKNFSYFLWPDFEDGPQHIRFQMLTGSRGQEQTETQNTRTNNKSNASMQATRRKNNPPETQPRIQNKNKNQEQKT
jgi:hypothetical protein